MDSLFHASGRLRSARHDLSSPSPPEGRRSPRLEFKLILGTDKRNPHLSVSGDADAGRLSVFYGLELLEVISNQPEHPAYKLMVGRLYNAGVKVRTLQEVFEVDRKTLQRWGPALHSGNEALLWRVLAGSAASPQTDAADRGLRADTLADASGREGCRNFRQRLRQEIQQIFGVSLSGEALRPLLQRLRTRLTAATGFAHPQGISRFARRPRGLDLRVRSQQDFYLDPHPKHYTGQQNVLKGWCPKIRWADKALHADFVHTAAGHPLYFELTDNYADLRQRLPGLILRLRAGGGWPADWVLNWVVDRGAFGRVLFVQMRDTPAHHLIPWEKDYHPEPWLASAPTGRLEITRARNSTHDTRSYHLQQQRRVWEQQQARKPLEQQRAQRRQGQQQRRLEAVQAQLATAVSDVGAASEGLAALRAQRARLQAAQTQGQSRVAPRQQAIVASLTSAWIK